MLFLNKLLPVFVLPIGVVLILVVLGLRQKWRWLGAVGAAVLYLSSLPAIGGWLLGRLESVHPRIKLAEAPAVDAIVVLGGVMGPPSGSGHLPNWGDSVERYEGGIALFQGGRAPRLLFTGDEESSEGATMRRAALLRGLPKESVAATGDVETTRDEAASVMRYCAEHNLKRVLLVTSAWHMPRAMRTFRRTGLEITPFPVDFRYSPQGRTPWYMDYLPNGIYGIGHTELALRECYGIAWYAVTGR